MLLKGILIAYIVGAIMTYEVCRMIRYITDHNTRKDKYITLGLSLLSFIGLIILIIAHKCYKLHNRYCKFINEFNKIMPIALLLLSLTAFSSCKKKNTQPTSPPIITPTPQENLWLLGGDWQCIGGDTMFNGTLHISYCCETNNGGSAVYYINYPIWCRKTNITVPYYYNKDTLRFDNCTSINTKQVYFAKIK